MEVILFQPQIPQNTGNIVRTCACTATHLTLVGPLGFSTASRHLKRAGLDYWEGVHVQQTEDLEKWLQQQQKPFYFLSSKARKPHTQIPFTADTQLIFGSETTGLPPEFCEKYADLGYTIPMVPDRRCLNLASSVAIVVYEGWRQLGFAPTN